MTRQFTQRRLAVLLLALTPVVCSTGCAGAFATMSWMLGGDMIPPRSKALRGKRVALLVKSDSATFGGSGEERMLTLALTQILRKNVSGIQMIAPDRIADWRDKTDEFTPNLAKLGKAVKADIVVTVNMEGFTTEAGKTLRKGKVDWGVTVYDVHKKGEIVYRTKDNFSFPKNGYHITDASPYQFRRAFVQRLAVTIGRHFHPYSKYEAVGLDPPGI